MDILLLPFDGSKIGAKNSDDDEIVAPPRSLIEELAIINGRTTLAWTARALAQSKRAQRIRVVCAPEDHEALRSELPTDARFEFQDFEGDDPFKNDPSKKNETRPTAESARELHDWTAQIIQHPTVLVSCGRPLLHGKTIDALIERAENENLDSAALILDDAIARQRWGDEVPTPHRLLNEPFHYLPLGVIGPQLLQGALQQSENFGPLFDRIGEKGGDNLAGYAPLVWKIVRTVGVRVPWKFMRRQAKFSDVENVMDKVFDTRFSFVTTEDANLVLSVGEAKQRAYLEKLLA